MIVLKVLAIIAIVLVALFLLTLVIYFFNLDMKFLSSCVEPILLRHYDRIPRKHYI